MKRKSACQRVFRRGIHTYAWRGLAPLCSRVRRFNGTGGAMRKFLTCMALCAASLPPLAAPADYRERLPEDEIVYFVLPDRFDNGDRANDRGGLEGERLTTGFDPTSKGFYHGGDLKGLAARLEYIQ